MFPKAVLRAMGRSRRSQEFRAAPARSAYALRQLPEGHDVPWHRIIQSSGRIAFDKGTPQYEEQTKRLMMDDVAVIAGRIDMQKYRWQPDLDELLWKPSPDWDDE